MDGSGLTMAMRRPRRHTRGRRHSTTRPPQGAIFPGRAQRRPQLGFTQPRSLGSPLPRPDGASIIPHPPRGRLDDRDRAEVVPMDHQRIPFFGPPGSRRAGRRKLPARVTEARRAFGTGSGPSRSFITQAQLPRRWAGSRFGLAYLKLDRVLRVLRRSRHVSGPPGGMLPGRLPDG